MPLFELDENQRKLIENVLAFCRKELNPNISGHDRNSEFNHEDWKKFGSMGLHGIAVPSEIGGGGIDPLTSAYMMEALGYGCKDNGLVFSLATQLVAVTIPIATHGNEAQRKRWLSSLINGEAIGCHAMTEPDTGSDAFSMRTTADKHGPTYRLNGVKSFVTNAPVAALAVVFALTDKTKGAFGGLTAFIVDLNKPGVRRGQTYEKMGLRSSPIGELVLENVELSKNDILGEVGGGLAVFNSTMSWERTMLFAAHCGTAKRILEETIQFARLRKQFGQHIGKYQAISHCIADNYVSLEAARMLIYKSASRLSEARGNFVEASMAKLLSSETFVKIASDSLKIHGGYGYTTESGVERELRDALASTIYSGTSEMQRNIIASSLGL